MRSCVYHVPLLSVLQTLSVSAAASSANSASDVAESEEEEEEEESLFKADAVNEEDPERDRATQV